MSRLSLRSRRVLIHVCYFLPLLFGILLLVYALIPHLWFVYDLEAYSTMSLFELQDNAWEFYEQIQAGAVTESAAVARFEQLLPVVSALFWVLPVLYGILSLAVAVCAVIAFSFEPTSRMANRTKRVLYLVCPNRVTYLLLPLLPLFSSLFPQLLLWLYRWQGLNIRLYTFFVADWVLVLILAAINAAVFIILLPMQSDTHLDLFRIYKSGTQVKRKGDETI